MVGDVAERLLLLGEHQPGALHRDRVSGQDEIDAMRRRARREIFCPERSRARAPESLTDKAATGAYRTAIDRNLPHGFTVSRADLAACMLASLSDPATVHRHVAIAS